MWAFWKLLHFNAQLKVLITYPYENNISDHLKNFKTMILKRNAVFKENQNFLIMFGLDNNNNHWQYYGFKYIKNKFTPINAKGI